MKKVMLFEELINESLKFDHATIDLAIHYLENETNKVINRNYKWLIDQLKSKLDTTSSINSDIELNQQEYDLVKKFSELAHKKYKGLDTD